MKTSPLTLALWLLPAGLRVTDKSKTEGSSPASKRFPATPGRTYELRFQERLDFGP